MIVSRNGKRWGFAGVGGCGIILANGETGFLFRVQPPFRDNRRGGCFN